MFSHVTRVISVATTGLLIALSIGLSASGDAFALTDAFTTAMACRTRCGGELSLCIDGCGFFFHRSCVNNCNAKYQPCVDGCFGETSSAFDDTVTLTADEHTLLISGPLTCLEDAKVTIDVTLTQESGAVARGSAKLKCQADTTAFHADLKAASRNDFLPFGAAKACGVAQIARQGVNGTAFQWCRDVIVVPEGVQLQD